MRLRSHIAVAVVQARAMALTGTLAQEPPYAVDVALKAKKKKKKRERENFGFSYKLFYNFSKSAELMVAQSHYSLDISKSHIFYYFLRSLVTKQEVMHCLSLFSGYNKILQAVWFINTNLFLIVLEIGSMRSRCQHDHALVKALSLVHIYTFMLQLRISFL